MKPMFYSGATSLLAHQKAMDNIGHNLSNANTTAFKSQSMSFDSLLYSKMYVNSESEPVTGHGVKAVSTGINFEQGGLVNTGGPLDFAIFGDAFFAVEIGEETQYTKSGVFTISMDGDKPLLSTPAGYLVLDDKGKEIELKYTKSTDDTKDTKEIDYRDLEKEIGLYRFKNASSLEPVSGGRYRETIASGEAEDANDKDAPPSQLVRGATENSNTSMAGEMANMIIAQRSYQLSAKVIQTADENEQIINNLRK